MLFHYSALLFIRWIPKQDTGIYILTSLQHFLATRGRESTTLQGQIHSGHWRHVHIGEHLSPFSKQAKSFFQS